MTSFDPDWCMRPGVILQEMMDDSGVSVRLIARIARLEPEVIEGILDGSQVITEEIASHLATGVAPLRISAQFWINFEGAYRRGLAQGKKDISDE
jgi:plasmid maintenance system antidote protein VapI